MARFALSIRCRACARRYEGRRGVFVLAGLILSHDVLATCFLLKRLAFWLGVSCFLRWVHGTIIDGGCAGRGRLVVVQRLASAMLALLKPRHLIPSSSCRGAAKLVIFPLAALPARLARVSFGQSGAFLNGENQQLGSLVLRPRLCTAGPFLKRHRFRKESDSMAESPNSQSRRHLAVSACGVVRGRKAHRHVDGGQLRGLHAGAAGRCTTWPTSCACKAGWYRPIPRWRTLSIWTCSAWGPSAQSAPSPFPLCQLPGVAFLLQLHHVGE